MITFTNKELFRLFLPLTIEQLLEYTVGLANSIMVAHVGEAAVSAVSLVEFIMALLISIFAALATGGAVIAGQYLGKADVKRARDSADQLIWFAGAVSIAIMLLVYGAKSFILHTMFGEISEDVRTHADAYLMIVALAIPSLAVYNAGAAIFRTMGNARLPMYIALMMGVTNIAGNALAVYGLGYGTIGIAASTLVSRTFGAVFIVLYALNPGLQLHIRKRLSPQLALGTVKRIMSIGVPFGFENGVFYFGRLVVLSLVATFGTAAIAANAVAGTLAMFSVLPGMAIGLGMTVVIAKCVGAGDYRQARYYNKKILAIVYVSHVAMNVLVVAALPLVLRIYDLSEAATALTYKITLWHAVGAITIWPLAYTLPVTFRAAGDARYPMAVSIAAMFICRVAMSYVLGSCFGMGMFGTWLAMFLDWIIKSILYLHRYFNNKWTLHHAT